MRHVLRSNPSSIRQHIFQGERGSTTTRDTHTRHRAGHVPVPHAEIDGFVRSVPRTTLGGGVGTKEEEHPTHPKPMRLAPTIGTSRAPTLEDAGLVVLDSIRFDSIRLRCALVWMERGAIGVPLDDPATNAVKRFSCRTVPRLACADFFDGWSSAVVCRMLCRMLGWFDRFFLLPRCR